MESWSISRGDVGYECFDYIESKGGRDYVIKLLMQEYSFYGDEHVIDTSAVDEQPTIDAPSISVLPAPEIDSSVDSVFINTSVSETQLDTTASEQQKIMEYDTSTYQKSNPKLLGEQGERTVREMLSKEYDVQRISSSPHSTDIKVRRKNRLIDRMDAILLEIKNYSNTVPTREVEKFESDVELHKNNIAGAIMISLRSGITKKKDFEFAGGDSSASGTPTVNNTNIPIIYASAGSTNLIRMLVAIMYSHIDLRNMRLSDEVNISKREEKFKKYSSTLGVILTNIAQARRSLNEMQTAVSIHMDAAMYKISETEYNLQSLMNKMVMLSVPKNVITNNTEIWKNPDHLYTDSVTQLIRESNSGNILGYNDEPDKVAHFLIKYAKATDDISVRNGTIKLSNVADVTIVAFKTKLNVQIKTESIAGSLCTGKTYYQDGMLHIEQKKFNDMLLCKVLDHLLVVE